MKWLQTNERNRESDEKYFCYYNELQFQIEDKTNKMNESIYRKICEQFQLLIITENMMILVKKLWSNLTNHKHKMISLYQKKSKPYSKNNDKSAVKLNDKFSQSKWDWSIKCFNCDRTSHIVKNCYLLKKKRFFTNTANKKDSWSSHKVYDFEFTQKNESTDKKTKKKSVKENSSNKKII